MDSKGKKIKGLITSLLSLAISLDATVFFVFFAFLKIESLLPSLFIAGFFFFEAAGRVYSISYTLANRRLEKESRERAKAHLALFMGVAETIYPIPWILAMVFLPYEANSYAILAFLLFKISAEVALSFFRYLPRHKKQITMASENLCSFCTCLSLFLGFLFHSLYSKGAMDKSLADLLTGIFFLVFFFAQNALFSILLLQGRTISRIKKMVNFGVKHSVGNYIVVTSSLMTVLISLASAIKDQNVAYIGIAVIYLSLGAIRLSALLWKNAIHRNVYNKTLAEASESKILIYVGFVLSALSVLFSLGIFWISKQKMQASATFVLVIQIAHGLFRLAICIKNYVSYQKKNQPFGIAVASLDMLIGVYSLFSLFLLINIYFNFSWAGALIFVLTWATFAGTLSLGGIMIWLGFKGRLEAKILAKEIEANSNSVQIALKKHNLEKTTISKERFSELTKDQKFNDALLNIERFGPASSEEENLLNMYKASKKANLLR